MQIKGRYINLKESKTRRKQIEHQLEIFGISHCYSRFEAVEGNKKDANDRQLQTGELGIWKSWIKLLNEEIEQDDQFEYLHIIEDDCILTEELSILCEKLTNFKDSFDLLATDMYTNPSIYRYAVKKLSLRTSVKKIMILNGIYTGCLPSIIIPKDKIREIACLLENEYENSTKMVPIDNFLVRLKNQGYIKIAVSLPFVTSVREDSILDSTIQERTVENEAIKKTQQLCYFLRKQLSTIENTGYCYDITKAAIELIGINTINEMDKESEVTNMVLSALENEHFKYKYRLNLIGEPKNPQNRGQS